MAPRYFTLVQANRTLPFVARVIGDLVLKTGELRRLEARRQELAQRRAPARAGPDQVAQAELAAVEKSLFDLEGELERIAQELAPIGCQLKDLERGLVDFLARKGDEVICLCWLAGEPAIEWWHDLQAGFAGRRPVAELPAETRGE